MLTWHCKHCDELWQLLGITLGKLEASSLAGCTFCTILLKGICAFANDADARLSVKAQYALDTDSFEMLSANTTFFPKVDRDCLMIGCDADRFFLEIFTEAPRLADTVPNQAANSQWKHMRAATSVSDATSSDTAFRRATEWLRSCDYTHIKCAPRTPKSAPGRLLDILHHPPKLVQGPRTNKYACLSHCWGGHQPLQT
ncbi:hypothetical protein LTR37_021535, partial [Vermiconidia calcicola]